MGKNSENKNWTAIGLEVIKDKIEDHKTVETEERLDLLELLAERHLFGKMTTKQLGKWVGIVQKIGKEAHGEE